MNHVRRRKTNRNFTARAIVDALHAAAAVATKAHARPVTLAHLLLGPGAVVFSRALQVDAYVASRAPGRNDAGHRVLLASWNPPRPRRFERLVARELGRWALRRLGMTFPHDTPRTLPTGRVVLESARETELATEIGDELVGRWTRKAA